jgi:hypothetical protein
MIIKMDTKKYGIKIIYIDDEDYNKIKKYVWFIKKLRSNYYAWSSIRINGKSKTIQMHQIIMGNVKNKIIDHKNMNGIDNRKCNLRFCTYSENRMNTQARKDNKSGLKGVSFFKNINRWIARIMITDKSIYLGCYKTAKKAHLAYCEAAKKYHGEFARTA